jgi:hypothetical protein
VFSVVAIGAFSVVELALAATPGALESCRNTAATAKSITLAIVVLEDAEKVALICLFLISKIFLNYFTFLKNII